MVKLATASGREVVLAPESIFGLCRENGEVWVQMPHLEPPNLGPFEAQIDSNDSADWRLWYGAGMVLSTGVFNDSESRPARIILPIQRKWELEKYRDFLVAWGEATGLRNALGEPWEVKLKEMGSVVCLSSRLLDFVLRGPCADFLEPVTLVPSMQQPTFVAHRTARKGFARGLLGGMEVTFEGRLFVHKHAEVVRMLNEYLFTRCSVPTELRINPHEPSVLEHLRRIRNPHALLLRRDHYLFAQNVGLAHWDHDLLAGGNPLNNLGGRYTDRIVAVTPVGEQEAIELVGDDYTSIDSFCTKLRFDVPEEALMVATMSELFVDVADPEAVLASAPVHMTHKHGEI